MYMYNLGLITVHMKTTIVMLFGSFTLHITIIIVFILTAHVCTSKALYTCTYNHIHRVEYTSKEKYINTSHVQIYKPHNGNCKNIDGVNGVAL